jgi:hypothetical protein
MKVQAQNGKPISGDPFPTNTRPTRGAGQLMGEPETIGENANTLNGFIKNKSLKTAADAGCSVVQQPKTASMIWRSGNAAATALAP